MIIFTDRIDLIPSIEFRFKRQAVIMNLSSARSGFIDLTPLMIRFRYYNPGGMALNQFVNTVEFDMNYANALQNDPIMYKCMQSIIFRSYEGEVVVILVYRDPYRDAIMESLIKLIQQKYGHGCWIVEDEDDIMDLKEQGFTPMGLQLIGEELQMYNEAYIQGKTEAVIKPISYE